MSVEGEGHVYFADDGKKVQVVELGAGESITVNGEDVLAFEESLSPTDQHHRQPRWGVRGRLQQRLPRRAGLRGAHYRRSDRRWSRRSRPTERDRRVGRYLPERGSQSGASDMIGQESGERYQMRFEGPDGFVVVQPREEHV